MIDPSETMLLELAHLYKEDRLGIVVRKANLLLRQFPNSTILYNFLGNAYHKCSNFDGAIKSYEKLDKIEPDQPNTLFNLANSYKDSQAFDMAIVNYKKVIKLDPRDAEAHNNMGICQQNNNDIHAAINSYNSATTINPLYFEAYNNLGTSFEINNNFEKAIQNYQIAIKINPKYPAAHNNLGNVLQKKGDYRQSIESYRKAIELRSDFIEAFTSMGDSQRNLKLFDEAIESYKQALKINPNYYDALFNLGNTFAKMSHRNHAITYYSKASLIDPKCADPYFNIGIIFKKEGKLDQAKVNFQRAIDLSPKDSKTSFQYAQAQHTLAIFNGETPDSAPRAYVENLFDVYSTNFDRELVRLLKYRAPELLVKKIKQQNGPSDSLGSILDLGCGTGLVGQQIRSSCSNLEGVDLSKLMLEKAREKKVYDKLYHRDILEFLATYPLDFDYFVSADVFIYVGELSEIFRLIKLRNKRPGKFVFSTEQSQKQPFRLESSGRYSHSKCYIEELSMVNGFSIDHFSVINLRKEKERYIKGALYILNF